MHTTVAEAKKQSEEAEEPKEMQLSFSVSLWKESEEAREMLTPGLTYLMYHNLLKVTNRQLRVYWSLS